MFARGVSGDSAVIHVIDTSALIRLFIPDGPALPEAELALSRASTGGDTLLAPDLILVEIANVLLRKLRRGELSDQEHDELLPLMLKLPLRIVEHSTLILQASALARNHKLSAYDAIFLALAQHHGVRLLTCEDGLAKVARTIGC